ncbi:MAG: hypothetical protein HY081_06570 [Gammaproteobacteria bacterium]|nr:hypothetical protein [Gammaproteobacteria bacterium]
MFIADVNAYADDSAARWQGDVEFAALRFDYREYADTGKLLDREKGTLPGAVLGLARIEGNWSLNGRFSWHNGDVLYDGQTNTGIPVRSRTDEKILDTSVSLERRVGASADAWPLAFYGGIGYRYWARDIRSTSTASGQRVDGLFEIYRWRYFFLGGKTLLYRAGLSDWRLDLQLFRPMAPTIEVDYRGRGENFTLDLGARTGWRLALPWEYRLNQRAHFKIEPYMEGWELGRSPTQTLMSNGVPAGTVYEPRSVTRNLGINLGIRYFF